MAKKVKGKQKQEEKPVASNVGSNPLVPVGVSMGAMGPEDNNFRLDPPVEPQVAAWETNTSAWGANAEVEPTGDTWEAPTHQPDDAWEEHAESLLQPPPSHPHSILPTIPEQSSSGHFTQNRSDVGESEESHDEYNSWNDHQESHFPQYQDGPQSQTLTATAAPSAMGSPAAPPAISIMEAAALAQKEMQHQKISSASEAARRLEESRARLSAYPAQGNTLSPAVHFEALKGHSQATGGHTPMSSASAAAALLESTANRLRAQNNAAHQAQALAPPQPGKTTWTYPKPFLPNGRPPAAITPDPSWIMTGGNAWSNKHRATKSASVPNWPQGNENAWNQQMHQHNQQMHQHNSQMHQHNPQMHQHHQAQQAPQPQQRPQHQKHHSHPGHPAQQQPQTQQNQSWQGWGKDSWDRTQGTESDSDDETVNGWGQQGGDAWGQNAGGGGGGWGQQPAHQGRGEDKREREHGRGRGRKQPGDDRGQADGWGQTSGNGGWDQGGEGGGGDWGQAPAADWGQTNDDWGQSQAQGHGQGRGQATDGWDQSHGQGQGHGQGRGQATDGWDQSHGQAHGQGRGQAQSENGWGQGGDGWGQTQADSGRGKPAESNWGTGAGDWGAAAHAPSNSEWGANGPQSKVTFNASEAAGTRNVVSAQQRSQILNSLLNQAQNQKNPNLTTAQHQAAQIHAAQLQAAQFAASGKEQPKAKPQEHKNVWEAYGNDNGWGSLDSSDDDFDDNRRVHFSPKASELWGGSPRSVPSKTLAQAQHGIATTPINLASNVRFVESRGAAFSFVSNAFFGNARFARERIHWMFPENKDERVAAMLGWVQKMSFNLGTYGLIKFLESRERGALFVNALFRMHQHPNEPAFDWLTFNQLQGTMDKVLQESVAFYDPARLVIIFVYLPSQTGNSVAIWRRKINVPDNARLKYQPEINAVVKTLRSEKEYIVMVDELPKSKPKLPQKPGQLRKSAKSVKSKSTAKTTHPNAQTKAKKKRKWWKLFLG
ncbi:hypothetical protein BDZ97DRAFT_1774637 [Flammula alnicola]|nr:hypothetical protein BDZ97DRAFT_1774637 [Flammula alnicola]